MPDAIEVRKVTIHSDADASELAKLIDDGVMAADRVIATDVDAVMLDWGTDRARPLGAVSVADLRGYAVAGQFASGSMGPKVEAVCRFVEQGGTRAVITDLDNILDAVAGETGTVVVPN